jgi:hypothetical protein
MEKDFELSREENFELKENIKEVESKNKKLFASLEKALVERAKDYKEKT